MNRESVQKAGNFATKYGNAHPLTEEQPSGREIRRPGVTSVKRYKSNYDISKLEQSENDILVVSNRIHITRGVAAGTRLDRQPD